MYKKSKSKVIAVVSAVLILGILYFIEKHESLPEERMILTESIDHSKDMEAVDLHTEESADICVYICGCVITPGVYTVPEGTRIHEVLTLAGGFAEGAEITAVNLAEAVYDGEEIRIPSVSEVQVAATQAASDGRVNINTAGLDELMTLPGIGKAKAEAVISYRTEHGKFSSIEALMEVSGIGEGIFSRLKDKIKI